MTTIMVVLTDAVEGRDDEFNAWYSDQHVHDVLAVKGFVAAQRFKLIDGDSAHKYLAIYEVEDGKLDEARAGLGHAREAGAMPVSDALAPGTTVWAFSSLTHRVTGEA